MEIITFALLAVLIGIRHGMDSDHVAAIADMVGTETMRRKQISLGVMYAIGHGFIVLMIGLMTIYIGASFPESAQQFIEILVGITLLLLGGVILFSVVKQKRDFEFKSRLKIVCEWIVRIFQKTGRKNMNISPIGLGIIGAFIIGIIHGIGVESPTQIAIITNAVGYDNMTIATLQLFLFVIGLLVSTIFMTFLLSWGFFKARIKQKLYIILGSITGVYSVVLGISIILDIMKGGV